MQTIIVTVNRQGDKTALQIDGKVIQPFQGIVSIRGVIAALSGFSVAAITAVTRMQWNLYRGA